MALQVGGRGPVFSGIKAGGLQDWSPSSSAGGPTVGPSSSPGPMQYQPHSRNHPQHFNPQFPGFYQPPKQQQVPAGSISAEDFERRLMIGGGNDNGQKNKSANDGKKSSWAQLMRGIDNNTDTNKSNGENKGRGYNQVRNQHLRHILLLT